MLPLSHFVAPLPIISDQSLIRDMVCISLVCSITCFGDLTNMMWFWWTLSTLFFVAVIVKFLTRRRHRLPPGPSGLPFVGNIFQIDSSCPHGTMTKWSEVYGDIFRIKVRCSPNPTLLTTLRIDTSGAPSQW